MKPYGPGLTCPNCAGQDLAVKDSRPSGDMIRRRRLCAKCGQRFTTFEMVAGFLGTAESPPLLAYRAMKLREKMDRIPGPAQNVILDLIEILGGGPADG